MLNTLDMLAIFFSVLKCRTLTSPSPNPTTLPVCVRLCIYGIEFHQIKFIRSGAARIEEADNSDNLSVIYLDEEGRSRVVGKSLSGIHLLTIALNEARKLIQTGYIEI